MADLTIENAGSSQEFRDALFCHNVELPVRPCPAELGVLLDKQGRDVLTVDSNGKRDDDEVREIAYWIAAAINASAGIILKNHN